ncbi:MAG TPA: efflux RND transporter periplasmic adaptor subunit [Gammaproteobacteria bacterium]|nr:efflux RND transporter periplasmic adaptor subunit [Gammaproteobacteria bacterium]
MIKRFIIVLAALVVVFGGIFGWKAFVGMKMAEMMSKPRPPAVIASATVKAQNWQPYLHAVGSLVARDGVEVSSQVDGQIRSINFDSGQTVSKGEVLLQLDDTVDRAALQGLVAEQKLAELEYKRQSRLLKQHSTSQSAYDTARASLDKAKAAVATQRARLSHMSVRAPFSGALGIRRVDLGEFLKAGSPIVSLQALDPIYVDFSLPERYLAKLSKDQKVLVTVQAHPGKTFEGAVSAISSEVQKATRNVQVRATLANKEHALRPGMFAEVRVALPARQGVLTVPRTAITYNPYGDSVFVIENKNGQQIVQSRQVETGQSRDGRVEITKGLKEGDEVVSAGQVKLRNGQPVKIDNSVKLDAGQVHSP